MKVDIEVLLELVKWELLVASMLTAAILLVVIPSWIFTFLAQLLLDRQEFPQSNFTAGPPQETHLIDNDFKWLLFGRIISA